MFDLIDVPMRMKYYFNGKVIDAGPVKLDEEYYNNWLASMTTNNDFMIFFLVAETTDVFEKIPTDHSCSCHIRNQGPCPICKELGCEVAWDFNQIALWPVSPNS